jgi:hypothetical protein
MSNERSLDTHVLTIHRHDESDMSTPEKPAFDRLRTFQDRSGMRARADF